MTACQHTSRFAPLGNGFSANSRRWEKSDPAENSKLTETYLKADTVVRPRPWQRFTAKDTFL
jgi:hypothetical protein